MLAPGLTGEMPQWSQALAALTEDPGSIPSTYVVAHNLCNPSLGTVLPPLPVHTHHAQQIHTQADTHPRKEKHFHSECLQLEPLGRWAMGMLGGRGSCLVVTVN